MENAEKITIELDDEIIDLTFAFNCNDFENAVHYYAAQKMGTKGIITRNKKDFSSAQLPIFILDEFLDNLDTSITE